MVVLRGAISAALSTVTVTPGSTAPCSSVAVPVIVPVCWANAGADRKQRERDQNCGLTHGEPPHEADWKDRAGAAKLGGAGENARWEDAAAP